MKIQSAILAVAAVASLASCKKKEEASAPPATPVQAKATPTPAPRETRTASGLVLLDTNVAKATREKGATVRFKFEAKNASGEKLDEGELSFVPGGGQTVAWLEEAVVDLGPGSRRKVTVPAALSKETFPEGSDPGEITLEVEVLE